MSLFVPLDAQAQGGNFKVGPVLFDVTGHVGATYSTNVTSSPVNPRRDLFLRAGIDAKGNWAVSKYNDLTFGLGLEYRKYIENPELDSSNNFLNVTPNTKLQFTIFAGEFRFIVSDSISFSTDPTDSVAVDPSDNSLNYDVLSYSRLNNTFRIATEWQLNPLWTAQASYSRDDVIPFDTLFDTVDRTQHTLYASLDRVINSRLTLGVYGSLFWNEYALNFQNDSHGHSLGVQGNLQVSDTLSVSGRYGWRVNSFGTGGSNRDQSDFSGVDYSVDVAHALSGVYTHRLSYSRSLDYGFVSNTTLVDALTYSFSFKGVNHADINGSLAWQNGRDSGGLSSEVYNRTQFRIGVEYALSRKLTCELSYEHSVKNSNLPRRDYVRNDITLLFRYDF